MTQDLFDREKFIEEFCLLRVGENEEFVIFDLERVEDKDFASKIMDFINSECQRNRIEAVKEVVNRIISETTMSKIHNAVGGILSEGIAVELSKLEQKEKANV